MKRLLLTVALACTAGCSFPRETKMEAVEPTDSQVRASDPRTQSKAPGTSANP